MLPPGGARDAGRDYTCRAMAELTRYPNRESGKARFTKTATVVLLLVSAAMIGLITIGGFSVLMGMKILPFLYIAMCLGIAYLVWKWNRGLLPVAASLGVLFIIVAGIAAPSWFERQ